MTLSQWVDANFIKKGRTQQDAAKALGIGQSLMSMYCTLQRFPRLSEQVRLEQLCHGLDMSMWRNAYLAESAKGEK